MSLSRITGLLRNNGCTTPLSELLRGSALDFPKPPPKKVNMELEKRRKYLQAQAEMAAYDKMVKGVSGKKADPERVGALLPSLSVGADMIVAMFATSIICFVAASSMGLDHSYVSLFRSTTFGSF